MMSGLQPGVRGSAFDRSADTERGAGEAGDELSFLGRPGGGVPEQAQSSTLWPVSGVHGDEVKDTRATGWPGSPRDVCPGRRKEDTRCRA